jgi:predicted secreted acid phosphatase
LFNAAIAKSVAVFFITGRRNKQREATLLNLDRAGYEGWTKLITRDDNDSNKAIQPFKTKEREKIAASGYTIIANVGDQQSDFDADPAVAKPTAECSFKLPNPFYFIP